MIIPSLTNSEESDFSSGRSLLRLSVMNVHINAGSQLTFINEMVNLSDHRSQHSYVCFMNVHMLVEANRNKEFLEIINGANMVCPDGLPIAKSIGWFYAIKQEQIAGPDTLPNLLKAASNLNKRVFILGSTENVIKKFHLRMTREYPGATLAGFKCPPFRILTEEEDELLVENINSSNADMIFVALGCPKQEKWMASHRDRVNGCMFGLGYAIPVFAGVENRAPRWMIDHGLEWLFRLSSDPRRLFIRYISTNLIFFKLFTKSRWKK